MAEELNFKITEEPIDELFNVSVKDGKLILEMDCEKIIKPMLETT